VPAALICNPSRTLGASRYDIVRVTGLRQTRRGIIKTKSWDDHIAALLGDDR